jgi:hypothetical protein
MICPYCRNQEESTVQCSRCGTNFESYEQRKQEQLSRVCSLLTEYRFQEAREIAQTLPTEFPDNRSDFLLLLSNISRDISIVDKCEQAEKAMAAGDHTRASLVLRNIQAFDKNLNERVISLRRKAELHTRDKDLLQQAVKQFDAGNYGAAEQLFTNVAGADSRQDATDYLQRLAEIKQDMLGEAVGWLKKNRFDIASGRLANLVREFPGLEADIQGLLVLVAKRNDIKETLMEAAGKARRDNRPLDAKIAYTLLGMQFPECARQSWQLIRESDSRTAVSLSELDDKGRDDLPAEVRHAWSQAQLFQNMAEEDILPADITGDGIGHVGSVTASQPDMPDTACEFPDIAYDQVADFIF